MRILIIRPGAIGDTLLTFPIIQMLRARYADSRPSITLVGNAAVLPLAQACGLVDEVADYEQVEWSALFAASMSKSDLFERLVTCYQLDQTDLAICWLRDPQGIVEHNLRRAGVKNVIMAAGRPPEGRRVHIVRYLAETVSLTGDIPPSPSISLSEAFQARNSVNPLANKTDKPVIAIHPGSGGKQKCWPAAHFAAVIELMWRQEYPVLLLGGPADYEQINAIHELLPLPPTPDMLHSLQEAPLLEVARSLLQCRAYLGNDSGITHLAAQLGLPTIALFGSSDPAVWRPVGPFVTVLQGHNWKGITVDAVGADLSRPIRGELMCDGNGPTPPRAR